MQTTERTRHLKTNLAWFGGGRLQSLFVLACLALCLSAQAKSSETTSKRFAVKDLIGLETNGPFYPNGWQQIGSDGFGSSPYILTTLRRKNAYAVLLKKQVNEPQKGERIRAMVTDAISVANPRSYHQFSRLCYFPSGEGSKTTSNILAEIGFAKFCDMKTTLIRRAWHINLQTGKFDRVTSTQGLTCEYGFVSLGEPDFREGCPTYNAH